MHTPTRHEATAIAPSNIAFVKYWGKREARLNLPVAGSLSMTLRGLETTTTVSFEPSLQRDVLYLAGAEAPERFLAKALPVLDAVRAKAGVGYRARIETSNSFPTGAGLASSASGLAALTVAAAGALGWRASQSELSAIARRGSGSASRSLVGGFAEWLPGTRSDGEDSYAIQVAAESHWSLRMLVIVVQSRTKETSSTSGMERTSRTSPYFSAFVDTVPSDLDACRAAIRERDFSLLARVMESSCLKMHASMLTSQPALWYWRPQTLEVLELLYALREEGHSLAFTIDAGPNVKVVLPPGDDDAVRRHLAQLACVQSLIETGPGPGARLVSPEP